MGMDAVRSIGLMRGDAINLISWRKFSVIRARRAGKVKSPPPLEQLIILLILRHQFFDFPSHCTNSIQPEM